MQVQRWGLPLYTHIFLTNPAKPELIDQFNAAGPADDVANYAAVTAEFAQKMSTYAGSVVNPSEYGKQVVGRLLPSVMPYQIGTEAAFGQAAFNGRSLGDDVMDIMLQLASNAPLAVVWRQTAAEHAANSPASASPTPRPNRRAWYPFRVRKSNENGFIP